MHYDWGNGNYCAKIWGLYVRKTNVCRYGYIHVYPRKIYEYGYGYKWEISYPRQAWVRPTRSGVQQLVVVISCLCQLFESGLTSSTRRSQSEILEFTSTLTSACDATFRKPLPAALPFFVSCAAFDVRCRRPFTKHSSSASSCPAGLRQCCAGRPTRLHVQPPPVGTQRCRTIHRRFAALGPHHRHTRQFPLVESVRACAVQAGDDRLPLTEWHSSIILGCRPATFVRHAVKMTSAVLTDTPAGCPPVAVRNCW